MEISHPFPPRFAAAAIGRAAFSVASFGHFIWLPKPWHNGFDKEANGMYGVVEHGHRLAKAFVVMASPPWVNAWRDHAVAVLGPEEYERVFDMHPHQRAIDWTILLDRHTRGSAFNCISANEGRDDFADKFRPIASCGSPRPEPDEPFPSGPWGDWDKIEAAVKKVPRLGVDPPDPEAERIRAHHKSSAYAIGKNKPPPPTVPPPPPPPPPKARDPPDQRAAAHDGALASGPDVIYGVDDITFIGIQPASAARRLDAEEPYWAWRLDPRSGARRSHGSSFEQSVPHPEDTFNAAMGIPLGVPPLRGIPAPTEPRRTAGA